MSRVALVTGASSGLGRALAIELSQRRWELVLLARDRARLEETRELMGPGGAAAALACADVREPESLRSALGEAMGDRPLDLLVHAAGILRLGPLDELSEEHLRVLLDVNVVGAAACVRATLDRLAQARGHVVLVASIAGRLALPDGFTAYGASKWAMRGWAEIARPELVSRGIGLTVAYPSIVDTAMIADQRGADAPGVYRAFPWHPPAAAARRILDDAELGRRESYLSVGDRLAAWAAGAMPVAFHAGLRAVVRARSRRPS